MSASHEQELLSQGLAALKAGDKTTAQSVLREVVKLNPRIIEAWMGLAQTTTDPARQRTCYENILKIDPDHDAARAALATLSVSAPEVESLTSDTDNAGFESLRPKKVTAIQASPSFAPPQSIPGAPARFSLDDLLDFMKNLLSSLQGTAGRGGNADALPASWWNITLMVVLAGMVTGLLLALNYLILGFGSPLSLITLPLLMPLKMAAGLTGATVLSRWFLQWRGQADGNLLDHTMALARPWFTGSLGLAILILLNGLTSSLPGTTLGSVLIEFSLRTTGFSVVVLIASLVIAIGAAYLTERGWAKLYPESTGTNRFVAAVLAMLMISLATAIF